MPELVVINVELSETGYDILQLEILPLN